MLYTKLINLYTSCVRVLELYLLNQWFFTGGRQDISRGGASPYVLYNMESF